MRRITNALCQHTLLVKTAIHVSSLPSVLWVTMQLVISHIHTLQKPSRLVASLKSLGKYDARQLHTHYVRLTTMELFSKEIYRVTGPCSGRNVEA